MSLALLQSYSSAEEDEIVNEEHLSQDQISSEDDSNEAVCKARSYKPLFDPNPQSSSSLPSALDAFSEIAGPPQFLNNSVEEDPHKVVVQQLRHGNRKNHKDKKHLPSGAVVESKAQLVGIRERVRSDVENTAAQGQSGATGTAQGGKRVVTVSNPNAEDAAELLRMCVKCGIPKTYSHAKGMICPVCGDHPSTDLDKEPVKKKGSTIKDKEKSKRMRGQSSHASWKSETEMQLRQQFD
ncbi:hypothetical protein F511_05390 [Dorcoceras hygrometricum]|uniref:Uncharacterized protein n=1 Tax=Dorcoceras hygrometricum TaxID=472368 RepID=A0A2Z7AMZ7_9LAMI|nr:hypothetical protein F511_05390 [Dorcoceras hygrometricum]